MQLMANKLQKKRRRNSDEDLSLSPKVKLEQAEHTTIKEVIIREAGGQTLASTTTSKFAGRIRQAADPANSGSAAQGSFLPGEVISLDWFLETESSSCSFLERRTRLQSDTST